MFAQDPGHWLWAPGPVSCGALLLKRQSAVKRGEATAKQNHRFGPRASEDNGHKSRHLRLERGGKTSSLEARDFLAVDRDFQIRNRGQAELSGGSKRRSQRNIWQ